jgi:hypothetical protein
VETIVRSLQPDWAYIYICAMQDRSPRSSSGETQALLARLYTFCFPGGEAAARLVRSVRTTQKGEMRMSPEARWIPFTAEEFTDTTGSNFRWDARLDPGKFSSPTVTDAYKEGHGRLVVKVAGVVPVHKVTGLDADKGELQRYLSSIAFCPPILLNHASLDCTAVSPFTLRVNDWKDSTGATVDVDISEEGQPLTCRAERPRIVGKQALITPWSGTCAEFREWEGLRVATRFEVRWHLPQGPFTYYRSEITSFTALR